MSYIQVCCGMLLLLSLFVGCTKSESLTNEEQTFVHISVALAQGKVRAVDSVDLVRIQDSIYKAFSTSKESVSQTTLLFSKQVERAPIVFRAIEDSLKN